MKTSEKILLSVQKMIFDIGSMWGIKTRWLGDSGAMKSRNIIGKGYLLDKKYLYKSSRSNEVTYHKCLL